MNRYAGKPLLRLIECYVLRAIGQLSQEDENRLVSMTPKLQEIYKVDGRWDQIIESVMAFPDSIVTQINSIWEKNRRIAEENGTTLMPQDFAQMFVDQNFPA